MLKKPPKANYKNEAAILQYICTVISRMNKMFTRQWLAKKHVTSYQILEVSTNACNGGCFRYTTRAREQRKELVWVSLPACVCVCVCVCMNKGESESKQERNR